MQNVGLSEIENVRIGKHITLEIEAKNKDVASAKIDEACEKIKTLTDFGKLLHEKNIQITIPFDIDLLGIKNGTYDLQRFIYDYFFKCFWNESWGYEYSNLVNVDWYHPKYCWRHSEDEIRSWCSEFNLSIRYIKELESGYACHVVKTSSII